MKYVGALSVKHVSPVCQTGLPHFTHVIPVPRIDLYTGTKEFTARIISNALRNQSTVLQFVRFRITGRLLVEIIQGTEILGTFWRPVSNFSAFISH